MNVGDLGIITYKLNISVPAEPRADKVAGPFYMLNPNLTHLHYSRIHSAASLLGTPSSTPQAIRGKCCYLGRVYRIKPEKKILFMGLE